MRNGWFFERNRHSLARKGISTSKRSGKWKRSFFAHRPPANIMTTGNRVQAPDGSRGLILMITDGVARVLTEDKRVIEVPIDELKKMDADKLYQAAKEGSGRVKVIPAASNITDDPFGEWHYVLDDEPVTQFRGNVIDIKQLFPDRELKVEGKKSSFVVSANEDKILPSILKSSEIPVTEEAVSDA